MRVTIIQDFLRMGGTERQTLFIARELMKAGHEVHLLLFRPGGSLWSNMQALEIPYTVLQNFDSHLCFFAPGIIETTERLGPDVILCMGRTANCYAGLIQRHLRKAHVVGTLRTGKVIFPLHHWALGRVSAVLVNSNWWQRRMLERGFPPEKVHVVHNALLLETPTGARSQWRAKAREAMGVKPGTCIFLNVATFRPGKRHVDLLEAFSRYSKIAPPNWELWLAGTGKEHKRCEALVDKLGLQKHVRFLGQQAEPGPLYSAADIAVSASREDSLPNFLIEAQAMGLPLVAVDCRGVIECCIPDETGIVIDHWDADVFAATLRRVAADEAFREHVAERAPRFTKERFCPERQTRLTVEFLEQLAQKRPNHVPQNS